MGNTLQILITAGGTSERIDNVRRITNSGTGALGAKIAEAFAAADRDCRITYICSASAIRPPGNVSVICADDIDSVAEAVKRACTETRFDIIIHSMAIGDYKVRAVSDTSLATAGVIERLSVLACGDSQSPEEAIQDVLLSPAGITDAKISSDKEDLLIVLEKAPKIIALYRGLAPEATIIGFKLLSDAGEEELVSAGLALLKKNDCDFVLANDMKTVRSDMHEGLLIKKDGTYERATGKDNIAKLIVKASLN